MADNDIVFSADLETGDFDSAIDSAIQRASEFEGALDELQGTLDGIDTSVSVDVEAVVSDSDSLDSLLELDSYAPEVGIAAELTDPTDVDSLLDLDELAPDVGIAAELTDREPVETLTDLDGTVVAPEIAPRETQEGKETISAIDKIAKLQVIDIAIQVAGNVMDVFNAIKDFTVTPFLDAETAAANLAARTGQGADTIKEYQQMIIDIQQSDLGESAGQIGKVLETAGQLGAPLDDAARAALGFTKVFYEQDPSQVLTTLNSLVSTGLAPDFQTAGDMLTGAFQNGANRGGDLLKTIQDNVTNFQQLGLSGEGAMGLITSGLDAGFNKASDVTGSLKVLQNNLVAAVDNPTGDTGAALASLGLDNPAADGTAYGAEFVQSVIDAVKAQPVADQAGLAEALFGKQGAIGTDALLNLDTAGLGDTTDAIAEAGATLDDTLMGALDDFKLEVQTIMTDFLSSESIDLPGKLDAIKTGLQTAVEVLAGGSSLGEALEVGFKIQGVDEFIGRFEGAIGNLIINFMEIVASVQDITGKDSTNTRAQIASRAADQLPFDLKFANADEVASLINVAIERGVDPATVLEATKGVVTELATQGATEQAQAIVDGIEAAGGGTFETKGWIADKLVGNANATVEVPLDPTLSPEAQAQAIADIESQLDSQVPFFVDYEFKPGVFNPADVADLQASLNAAAPVAPPDDFLQMTKDIKPAADDAAGALDNVATSTSDVAASTAPAADSVTDLHGAMADGAVSATDVSDAIAQASMASSDFATALALAIAQAEGLSTSIDTLAGKAGSLSGLSSGLQSANLAAAGYGAGGSGGGGSSSSVTVNQTFNVGSQAQADSAAAQTGNSVRGFQPPP